MSRRWLALASLTHLFTAHSPAATLTWTGADGNDSTATGANWQSGTAPVNYDSLVFAGGTRLAPTLSTNLTVTSLTFGANAGPFTLSGPGFYTLYGGTGIVNSSTSVQTINNGLIFTYAQKWSSNAGSLVLNGNIDNNSNRLTLSSTTGTITLNGVLSGSGGFTKSGTSRAVILNGTNTYTGSTTLEAGFVQVGNNSAFGTSTIKFNSATLKLSAGGSDRTLANGYSIDKTLIFTGQYGLNLSSG
jgi:fibronectin-binding autotransporter adhesin